MKKMIIAASLIVLTLAACGKQNGPLNLSPEDMARASANAKQYYTQKHKGLHGGQAWEVQGVFTSCNGVDSNANGLTSCFGKLPDATGQNLVNQQMYCGYDGKIDACQPNDLMLK
jgi:predicted small lipoprotein YifL